MRARGFWKIIKVTKMDKILSSFVLFIIISSFIFAKVEPNVNTFLDGLWYSFSVLSSCGFGDIVAVTLIGRVLSIVLGIYAIFVIALVPGVVVSYYIEFMHIKKDETVSMFMDKLENLPNLSKEELTMISDNIKQKRYKNERRK